MAYAISAKLQAWPSRRGLIIAAPLLLIALIPLVSNWKFASRSGHYFTQQWAHDYLNSLEPYAIVVTNGDNDTFPLWYAQEVEGVRRDVTVAVTTYLDTDWFVRQMIRRPIETYDAAKGPAIYRDKQWKKPSGPPLKMTFADADAIPEYIQINQPQVFRQGNIVLNIPPGYLVRDELVLLRMIASSAVDKTKMTKKPATTAQMLLPLLDVAAGAVTLTSLVVGFPARRADDLPHWCGRQG